MANYFVDPAAPGANTGVSWEDAWIDLQTALNTVPVGSTCYCRGTQYITNPLVANIQTGNVTDGYISFIGCNSLGEIDGSRFFIDANGVAQNCLEPMNTSHFYLFRGFEFRNAINHGVFANSNACSRWAFVNCVARNNGGRGFSTYRISNGLYLLCGAFDNGSDGFNVDRVGGQYLWCVSRGNAGKGIVKTSTTNPGVCIGSISYQNTDNGVELDGVMLHNITHGNGGDGVVLSDIAYGVGNRVTQHTNANKIGVNANNKVVYLGWNFLQENPIPLANTVAGGIELSSTGEITNVVAELMGVSDVNCGYVDLTPGLENFNLREDATLRKVAIPLMMD